MSSSTKTTPNIPIIYEDNHLLVIDKPAGVLSQEDRTGAPDVLTLCKKYIKKEYKKPGNVWLGLVHRLDRPVSGLMVLAKTSKAASRLSEEVRKNNMSKTYWALVYGMAPMEQQLTHFLEKDRRTNLVKAYNSKKKGGKEARLSFSTIKQSKDYSVVEVNLETGRPHQIRVQLAKIGHPIFGDYKYGEQGTGPGKQLALRSMKLSFKHPTKDEMLSFEAPAPKKQPWDIFQY
ncbi:MAG: RNA pseudouridine synthase [Balneola sp.]|nr:MAG: RNA pseudouridine synthase [Balneola sp.]